MKKIIDAEFDVISGPTAEKPDSRGVSGLEPFRLIFGGLICLVAAYTLLLGLAGADLDTRDAVAANAAKQPIPYVAN